MKSKRDCPFCGENDLRILDGNSGKNPEATKPGFQAECFNCAARGPCGFIDAASALTAWEDGIKINPPTGGVEKPE